MHVFSRISWLTLVQIPRRNDTFHYAAISLTPTSSLNFVVNDYLLAELQDPPEVGRTGTCRFHAVQLHIHFCVG